MSEGNTATPAAGQGEQGENGAASVMVGTESEGNGTGISSGQVAADAAAESATEEDEAVVSPKAMLTMKIPKVVPAKQDDAAAGTEAMQTDAEGADVVQQGSSSGGVEDAGKHTSGANMDTSASQSKDEAGQSEGGVGDSETAATAASASQDDAASSTEHASDIQARDSAGMSAGPPGETQEQRRVREKLEFDRDPREAPTSRVHLEKESRTLFVRNLSFDVREEDLRKEFEAFGPLDRLFNLIDRRGMCFISYYDLRHAVEAKKTLHQTAINGRPMDVHFSLPRQSGSDPTREPGSEDNQGGVFVALSNPTTLVTDDDVRKAFEKFGDIHEVRGMRDPANRVVEYYDSRDAAKARHEMDGATLGGGTLRCEFARPAKIRDPFHNRDRGGGGGGRGRPSRYDDDDRYRGGSRYDDDYDRDRGRSSRGAYRYEPYGHRDGSRYGGDRRSRYDDDRYGGGASRYDDDPRDGGRYGGRSRYDEPPRSSYSSYSRDPPPSRYGSRYDEPYHSRNDRYGDSYPHRDDRYGGNGGGGGGRGGSRYDSYAPPPSRFDSAPGYDRGGGYSVPPPPAAAAAPAPAPGNMLSQLTQLLAAQQAQQQQGAAPTAAAAPVQGYGAAPRQGDPRARGADNAMQNLANVLYQRQSDPRR